MKNSTTIGLVIAISLIISACSNLSQKEHFKDFEYEQDFETNKAIFSNETFTRNGHSTEGGEIIIFQSKKRNYTVYDVWTYHELGKRNTTYFVDKSNTFKLVKQTTYKYDKPIYLEGATTKELVQYFTYNEGDFKCFSNIKLEIKDDELKSKKREELEQLFDSVFQISKIGDQKKNE